MCDEKVLLYLSIFDKSGMILICRRKSYSSVVICSYLEQTYADESSSYSFSVRSFHNMFLQKAQTFKTIQFKRIPEDNIIQGILVIITKLRTLMGEKYASGL